MLVRPLVLRSLLFAYPLLMTYVVMASGNHYWLDAVFGLVTAGLAIGMAFLLARLNPDWSFHGAQRGRAAEIEPQPEVAPA